MQKKNNVPRGTRQKRALCTSCGENPRRAANQRWCLKCAARYGKQRAIKQRSLLAEIKERLEIMQAAMERK